MINYYYSMLLLYNISLSNLVLFIVIDEYPLVWDDINLDMSMVSFCGCINISTVILDGFFFCSINYRLNPFSLLEASLCKVTHS